MIRKESVKYSLNNLKKRKTRSLLTILSIFVGIATIFLFISFGLGLYNYVNSFISESSADKVTIQPKGNAAPGLDDTFALTKDDLRAIERASGINEVSGVYFKVAEIEKNNVNKFVFAVAYDPEKYLLLELNNIKIFKGRNLKSGDEGKVVAGYNYLIENKIFKNSFDVNDVIEISGKDFRIIGFYEPVGNPSDDSQVYMTETQFEELYNETKGYNMIVASVDVDKISNAIDNIEKNLRDSRNVEEGKEDFTVSSFEDMLEQFTSALNIIIGFVILIALISVVVSAINTANTMITSVLERVKEIGVMKSIGARNSEILKIFLFESSFLGFMAGVVGVFLGWLLAFAAGTVLLSLGWGFLQPYYPWQLFLGCILFATVTGAISGIVPAISASRTNPVEALRYE